jgi:hypothetical protein
MSCRPVAMLLLKSVLSAEHALTQPKLTVLKKVNEIAAPCASASKFQNAFHCPSRPIVDVKNTARLDVAHS